MKRRLARMCLLLMAVFLIGVWSLPRRAQADNMFEDATLQGIDAVSVAIEDLPPAAKVLGLTSDTLKTDVERKLRHFLNVFDGF